MSYSQITHAGFADESHWNDGRFRSLGLVTLSSDNLEKLSNVLSKLLSESNVSEFKWKRVNGAKERFAALKLCEFAVKYAHQGILRIDVLIWDTEDARHKVPLRDDIANLQRMYYHLFKNVLRLRWPSNAVWQLYPDEHTAMDWESVQDFLERASENVEIERSLFTRGEFRLRLQREFAIENISPLVSHEHPFLQVADLFAGLAAFSREKFNEYQQWLKGTSPQLQLLEDTEPEVRLSGSTKERFPVLQKLDDLCKQRKLGVSLKSSRGLKTFDPSNPINFWLYEPQHPEDKAPTKKR